MQTRNKLFKHFGPLALLFRLWRQLAKASLICWWVTKGKPFCLKLKTAANRRPNAG